MKFFVSDEFLSSKRALSPLQVKLLKFLDSLEDGKLVTISQLCAKFSTAYSTLLRFPYKNTLEQHTHLHKQKRYYGNKKTIKAFRRTK